MELSTAIHLIKEGIHHTTGGQQWCDLGAGEGLFTNALGSLLPRESIIYAVDTDSHALNKIKFDYQHVTLQKLTQDFINFRPARDVDGIMMANSLHFVERKVIFLKNILNTLKSPGNLIIVEYDTTRANRWIPFPLNFTTLKALAAEAGYSSVQKLAEVPSVLNKSNIYSAVLR